MDKVGGKKVPPPLKSVTRLLQWCNLALFYLTLRRPKKYMNHVTHPLISADISIFSSKISRFLLYQKIQIQIPFWYITTNSFNFLWVFKYFFNKYGYNFVDVSKIGYSRPFSNKDIAKWRLWRHNSWIWRHQQIFIKWLKLYRRCGHVTKVWQL